jgi:hypothetical protein
MSRPESVHRRDPDLSGPARGRSELLLLVRACVRAHYSDE